MNNDPNYTNTWDGDDVSEFLRDSRETGQEKGAIPQKRAEKIAALRLETTTDVQRLWRMSSRTI